MKKIFFILFSLFLSVSAFADEFRGKILRLVPDDEGVKVVVRGTGFDTRILSIYLLQEKSEFKSIQSLLQQAQKDKSTVIFDVKKDTLILIEHARIQK